MAIKNGFKFKVKYVKVGKTSNGGNFVRFQIGDKITDSDGKYINYSVTVFDAPNINDGDTVTIQEINNLEVKEYKDKLYYSFTAKLKEEVKEVPQENSYDDGQSLPFDI